MLAFGGAGRGIGGGLIRLFRLLWICRVRIWWIVIVMMIDPGSSYSLSYSPPPSPSPQTHHSHYHHYYMAKNAVAKFPSSSY